MGKFESDESAFNFAVAYLKRVNDLMYVSAEAKAQRELRRWFDTIRATFGEVRIKFNTKEIRELMELEKIITKIFMENPEIDLGDYKEVFIRGRLVHIPNHLIKREELFNLIDDYDYKIRKLADNYGMLLPGKSDPRFAILKR